MIFFFFRIGSKIHRYSLGRVISPRNNRAKETRLSIVNSYPRLATKREGRGGGGSGGSGGGDAFHALEV